MSSDPESELIAQQLKHTVDLLRFEIDNLKTTQAHAKEISDHRFTELEQCTSDHEQRIRTIQDDVTRSKSIYTLASGGSTFTSLIALLRTFFITYSCHSDREASHSDAEHPAHAFSAGPQPKNLTQS